MRSALALVLTFCAQAQELVAKTSGAYFVGLVVLLVEWMGCIAKSRQSSTLQIALESVLGVVGQVASQHVPLQQGPSQWVRRQEIHLQLAR